MIELKLVNHSYGYEVEDVIRMYFGKSEIKKTEEALAENRSFLQNDDVLLVSMLNSQGEEYTCTSELYTADKQEEFTLELVKVNPSEKDLKRLVKKSMYKLLSKALKKEFPWGILTGIRPVKLVHDFWDRGFSADEITRQLQSEYFVSNDRAILAVDIAERERPFIYPEEDNLISIYIGIPFCPSRCHYCSFTSNSIKRFGDLADPYLEALVKEIRTVSEYLKYKEFKIQTIYIGGGTPTSVDERQLERLVACVNECFGSQVREFTCEAGRPDSINEEKLKILKAGKVSRISINPQTMNDETLCRIGRAHNTEEVRKSFETARNLDFDNINMDIILGLPGETIENVANTLNEIRKLDPESITVHTMAIKRASVLNERLKDGVMPDDEAVIEMMEYTKKFLIDMSMKPYYLYRQKHMAQNLENIGFSKEGLECIYNIQIIEEKQTIAAFGADAVTKTVIRGENRIERQHNIKDIKLYIENIDGMIKKKIDVLEELQK